MKKKEKIYSIGVIVLILDQFIKALIKMHMTLGSELKLIPHFFSLMYLKNSGAAFSILNNSTIFLEIISVVVLVLLDRFITKEKDLNKYEFLALGLIMGGIVGNLIDRLFYGAVIDYLSFTFGNYNFPVFNLADSAIVIGAIIFLVSLIGGLYESTRKRSK